MRKFLVVCAVVIGALATVFTSESMHASDATSHASDHADWRVIRSKAEFIKWAESSDTRAVTFRKMPKDAQERFTDAAVFTDKGLASFDRTDMQNFLTLGQIYQVLSAFGSERYATHFTALDGGTDVDTFVKKLKSQRASVLQKNGASPSACFGCGGGGGGGGEEDGNVEFAYCLMLQNPDGSWVSSHTCPYKMNSTCTSNC